MPYTITISEDETELFKIEMLGEFDVVPGASAILSALGSIEKQPKHRKPRADRGTKRTPKPATAEVAK